LQFIGEGALSFCFRMAKRRVATAEMTMVKILFLVDPPGSKWWPAGFFQEVKTEHALL
jgi:hypothetical protein